ncbi:helix-turn-helix domain-containing protein [Antarcticibacterium flavum]|uniref:Helix-turn-helix domain-containing protein n=1 Tax=Antarcticibacterium flavum TaxID=2058175 RepID=A0A5B7X7M3_9FLAO|nr:MULTISPECIES: helix-turn-helix domain-containing protein [Antarcticibacterium]MCM4161867.1 DNA-binding protein [Antarcticibacterium sp. W02-3]QCY70772.1 helix-turn-helix domain-containing protein [Antarcticibacterium flavum]
MSTLQFIQTSPEELVELINDRVKIQLQNFKKEFNRQEADEELLTREETCNFLKINSSTLWHWTNSKKVTAYGIGNRRYYKRSELINCLTQLQK